MNDPITQSLDPANKVDEVNQPSGYLVRHNDKIVGIFDNEFDAQDSLQGYQMQNQLDLNDTLDILKIL